MCLCSVFLDGNQDGKFSVGFRDGVVRTVVALDRETQAAYTLIVEAIGVSWIHTFTFIMIDSFIILITQSGCIFVIIGVVFLWSSKLLLCTFVWQWQKTKQCKRCICSDFRLLLNCLCSCLKREQKLMRFSCFGNHWDRLAYVYEEGARDTREGRRGRDHVKLCKRTELRILSQFASLWTWLKFWWVNPISCPGVNPNWCLSVSAHRQWSSGQSENRHSHCVCRGAGC